MMHSLIINNNSTVNILSTYIHIFATLEFLSLELFAFVLKIPIFI